MAETLGSLRGVQISDFTEHFTAPTFTRGARYAREHRVPYLGICLGMQLAVIEYARDIVHLDGAHSTEFEPETPHPVIALITEWQNRDGSVEKRTSPPYSLPARPATGLAVPAARGRSPMHDRPTNRRPTGERSRHQRSRDLSHLRP